MTSVSDAAERELELFGARRLDRESQLFGTALDAIVHKRQQGLDDEGFVPGQIYAALEDIDVGPDRAREYADAVEAALDDHDGIDSVQDILIWRETLADQYQYALTSAYEETLDALLIRGCSPAEAIDYWGVEERGFTQSGWAERRGVGQDNVSRNIAGARDELGE